MEKDNKNNTKNSLISHNKSELSFNIFKSDNDFILIYKKTERIVSAVYLVTKHLTNEEPIKWNLRKEGGQLLSNIILLKNNTSQRNNDTVDLIEKTISIIASQLEVSYLTGIISENNFSILNAELAKLLGMIDSYSKTAKKQHLLFDSMFFAGTDKKENDNNEESENKRQNNFIGQEKNVFYKNNENTSNNTDDSKGHESKNQSSDSEQKNKKESKTNMSEKAANALKQVYEVETATDLRKTNRRTMIVNTIQKKGEVMIKDLVPVIKGCSEKTIQRELAALVKKGVLEKIGERRWSKYKLA